ncbi:two-component system sensor histidine kinase NtrB [Alicyclobacillus acidoterrestris]|uniref:histidine kinase n=1 Tax=Alicyclobacillus acidoterrestris (strain ATCC 49025 / DSM 3922 / CIP 106132 / NCIMB 13137 / GD3B) TaxID=1356854 RepID=T0CK94_ALIAG|nr:ATP-binding protein [Alicyclobacillus acidoterrestris]EPZ53229.1 hypothetical protein N007_00320 [Alicyclobacillus acidoterrestris ATCC 49025]UNO49204.1 ATP-binding protein [Alicyclobacillus acidoterrestris]
MDQHSMFSVEPDLLPDTQLLNAGILYLAKYGTVAILNDISAELIGMPQATGSIVPLEMVLSEECDEYQILLHILNTECEYRDAVVRWEVGTDVRHVLMDTFTHQAADGQVQGMYIVMKDMGNFATLDQQTQRLERVATVGKVAAGIAHEIRNPLTTVKGFLQVLENRLHEGLMEEEVQYVEVMMSEIERVNTLVAELLLLSKPNRMDKRTFPMAELLNEIHPWIQANARERHVECLYDIPEGLTIFGDRDMLRQLLLHLIKNAVEAMDAQGSLAIGAKQVAGRTEIYISDTGPGIPYYLVDKIFDAFYTTKDKGTGLGLAICERIVADHGGTIRVASKGFGTTFTVSLPNETQSRTNLFLRRNAHSLSS